MKCKHNTYTHIDIRNSQWSQVHIQHTPNADTQIIYGNNNLLIKCIVDDYYLECVSDFYLIYSL